MGGRVWKIMPLMAPTLQLKLRWTELGPSVAIIAKKLETTPLCYFAMYFSPLNQYIVSMRKNVKMYLYALEQQVYGSSNTIMLEIVQKFIFFYITSNIKLQKCKIHITAKFHKLPYGLS